MRPCAVMARADILDYEPRGRKFVSRWSCKHKSRRRALCRSDTRVLTKGSEGGAPSSGSSESLLPHKRTQKPSNTRRCGHKARREINADTSARTPAQHACTRALCRGCCSLAGNPSWNPKFQSKTRNKQTNSRLDGQALLGFAACTDGDSLMREGGLCRFVVHVSCVTKRDR